MEGSRNGRVLLVQHHDVADPEHGGSYTVKIYERFGEVLTEGGERRASILLKPDSDDPRFGPIVLTLADESQVNGIAEVVAVLPKT